MKRIVLGGLGGLALVATIHSAQAQPPSLLSPNFLQAAPTRFEGFYAGAFGAYDFSQGKASSGRLNEALNGPGGGGFVGYNAVVANKAVIGFELRGGASDATAKYGTSSTGFTTKLPAFLGSVYGDPRSIGPNTIPTPSSINLSSAQRFDSAFSKTANVDLSARVGLLAYDRFLLFSRLGAGVQGLSYNSSTTTTSRRCVNPVVALTQSPGFVSKTATGCGSITSQSQTSAGPPINDWAPYGVFALGIEYNFDRYFARLEGQGQFVFPRSGFSGLVSNAYFTPSVNGAVGLRF